MFKLKFETIGAQEDTIETILNFIGFDDIDHIIDVPGNNISGVYEFPKALQYKLNSNEIIHMFLWNSEQKYYENDYIVIEVKKDYWDILGSHVGPNNRPKPPKEFLDGASKKKKRPDYREAFAAFFAPPDNSDYSTLGLTPDASWSEIKKAYRYLAFKNHPDRNQDDSNATERMVDINNAYKRLEDKLVTKITESIIRYIKHNAK